MNLQVAVLAALGMSSAQYVPLDTADVAAAKQAHFAAHAAARGQAYAAPVMYN